METGSPATRSRSAAGSKRCVDLLNDARRRVLRLHLRRRSDGLIDGLTGVLLIAVRRSLLIALFAALAWLLHRSWWLCALVVLSASC